MTDEIELKPCPFCGKLAHIRDNRYTEKWAECDTCSASTHSDLYEPHAIEDWNTRPIEDALRAELAAVTTERDQLREDKRNMARLLERVLGEDKR